MEPNAPSLLSGHPLTWPGELGRRLHPRFPGVSPQSAGRERIKAARWSMPGVRGSPPTPWPTAPGAPAAAPPRPPTPGRAPSPRGSGLGRAPSPRRPPPAPRPRPGRAFPGGDRDARPLTSPESRAAAGDADSSMGLKIAEPGIAQHPPRGALAAHTHPRYITRPSMAGVGEEVGSGGSPLATSPSCRPGYK